MHDWLEPIPSPVEKLITGTGRCGTSYITDVLTLAGCYAYHERPRAPILVGWGFAPRWKLENKDKCLHIVREPLKCIRSLQTTTRTGWKYATFHIKERTGVDLAGTKMLYKCMYRYLAWNQIAEDVSFQTFQIESVQDHLDLLADFGNTTVDKLKKAVKKVSTSKNHRRQKAKNLTWRDLKEVDADLTEQIREMAERYGY